MQFTVQLKNVQSSFKKQTNILFSQLTFNNELKTGNNIEVANEAKRSKEPVPEVAPASYQTGSPTMKTTDLEHLKPSRPSKHASSMRGEIIFSIISVMTVKVGSTMKSMNPVGIPVLTFISLTDTFASKEKPFSDFNYTSAPYQSGTGLSLLICGHKGGKKVDLALLLCHPEKVELFKRG